MLLSRRRLIALLGTIPLVSRAFAATAADEPLPSLPEPATLPLYPGAAPGTEHWTQQEVTETSGDYTMIRNVTRPALLAYRPARPNGNAVILTPGGAFYFLSMSNEGFDTARKLLAAGFTVFILKYRLIPTSAGWHDELVRRLSQPGWEKTLPAETGNFAVADAQVAIRLVRTRAAEFHIDPSRIGIVGFSAGGYISTRATIEHTTESRPDFAACVYGVKPELPARAANLPPLFMVWADDDDIVMPEKNALPLYQLWKGEAVPVELHLFAKGGHGFGSLIFHRPSDRWLELFIDWINSHKTFAKTLLPT